MSDFELQLGQDTLIIAGYGRDTAIDLGSGGQEFGIPQTENVPGHERSETVGLSRDGVE